MWTYIMSLYIRRICQSNLLEQIFSWDMQLIEIGKLYFIERNNQIR